MSSKSDPMAWARLRFAIVGPLLATPPESRELRAALQALAERDWVHPRTGLTLRFGFSTIERWYYCARHAEDPVRALCRQRRTDNGVARAFSAAARGLIRSLYAAHPGWSVQLHHDNLVAASELDPSIGTVPSYSSLKRYFRTHGLVRVPQVRRDTPGARAAAARFETLEVRSYEADHVHGLWHLDFHHGSRRVLEPDGRWIRPLLLGVLDDHSRLGCHLQWYRTEDTEALVHGFCQALAKRGLPRALMSDNGAAMISEEFTNGLEALGIVHERTLSYSPYQNGKQETLWSTLEGRLMGMIESNEQLTLAQLNLYTQLWLEQDYHQRRHSELATSPIKRFTEAASVGRPAPDSARLREVFRCRVVRRQRRSDGTVSLAGRRIEIPSRFGHLEQISLSYARWDLSHIHLIDPDTGATICALYPQDKSANAAGIRRAREPRSDSASPVEADLVMESDSAATDSPLMDKLLRDYIATGLPPGFIPSP